MQKTIKKKKKILKKKILISLILIFLGIVASYKTIESKKLEINDKQFIEWIVESTFPDRKTQLIEKVVEKTIEKTNPIKWMSNTYQEYLEEEKEVQEEKKEPIIYLYNSHQTEQYAYTDYLEFTLNPTVMLNNYILEDIFNKKGYTTYVEEFSIPSILQENNWNYASSYKASRILLEKRILEYPSLKYFIDIHRDSLSKEKTTITIEEKDYAKILFIVGLENPSYENNLAFTESIQQKLEEHYPGLSKGILKKEGPGVNGVYNQDFSEHTILIEIGGYENTTNEVLNSAIAFSKCFMEVIHE